MGVIPIIGKSKDFTRQKTLRVFWTQTKKNNLSLAFNLTSNNFEKVTFVNISNSNIYNIKIITAKSPSTEDEQVCERNSKELRAGLRVMEPSNFILTNKIRITKGDCELEYLMFSERSEPIVDFKNFYNQNFLIPVLTKLNIQYGGCSLMAEREVVVLVAGVRFSSSAFIRESNEGVRFLQNANFEETKNPCRIFVDSSSAFFSFENKRNVK